MLLVFVLLVFFVGFLLPGKFDFNPTQIPVVDRRCRRKKKSRQGRLKMSNSLESSMVARSEKPDDVLTGAIEAKFFPACGKMWYTPHLHANREADG